MAFLEKILVPVDGSRYSLNAVCLAARLARVHGSELRIFHVIDEALLDQLARFSEKKKEAVREELRNTARAFLSDMRCEAHREIVTASELIIREGVPHEIILEEAASWGADLIVLGKLGRRGVSHILLGSVAERVIDFAEIPVLVVT
jgi:nucleotide-binding universal stress UspA family protein